MFVEEALCTLWPGIDEWSGIFNDMIKINE